MMGGWRTMAIGGCEKWRYASIPILDKRPTKLKAVYKSNKGIIFINVIFTLHLQGEPD
jgi:hypothetical protein